MSIYRKQYLSGGTETQNYGTINVKMFLRKVFVGLAIAVVTNILVVPAARSAAACDTLAQDKGQASYSVSVEAAGNYTLWVRMAMHAPDHDSVFVRVDSQCPITVGDKTLDGLRWVNYADGNATSAIRVDLTAGTHTIKFAGREAGVVVDKIMFVGDPTCVPAELGDNCLAATTTPPPIQSSPQAQDQPQTKNLPQTKSALALILKIAGVLMALGALGFMVAKFIAFERRVKVTPIQIGMTVVGGEPYKKLHMLHRIAYFARHHRMIVGTCGVIMIASIAVSLVAAASYPVFEAESGSLSGGAKVADREGASGGKVVIFETNPVNGTAGSTSGNTQSGSGGSSSTGNSGSSNGGGSNNGGGSGTCAVSTQHLPDGPDGMGGCWPGPSNTGVPNGVALSNYSGPCTITTPNTVIDAKNITCQILVRADNLTIKRSYLTGGVSGLESDGASFRIEDSTLENGVCADCSVDGWNSTILRTEINGSNRGLYCMHVCLLQDSWIHGTALDPNSQWHASAMRAEQYATVTHNVLACDWTGPFNNDELGCSADMSGYPDFAPIHHNTISSNLFRANPVGLGFCAYGGGTGGKPYSNDPLNATYVVFTNNVFERGSNNKCGTWGAITDFIVGRTGNQWTGNKWSDGATVNPE